MQPPDRVTAESESSKRDANMFSERATDMAEHKHGEMDISVQEKTFAGFISMVTKGTIACILLIIFIGLVNG